MGVEAQNRSIDFEQTKEWKKVLKKAKKEKKLIFVDCYTSWCGPCKMMAKNVFTRQEVGDYYNNKFVCLKLDAEKESSHAFFKHYQANGYPSFFWLDARGNLLDTRTGSVSPEDFIRYAEEAAKSDLSGWKLPGNAGKAVNALWSWYRNMW